MIAARSGSPSPTPSPMPSVDELAVGGSLGAVGAAVLAATPAGEAEIEAESTVLSIPVVLPASDPVIVLAGSWSPSLQRQAPPV